MKTITMTDEQYAELANDIEEMRELYAVPDDGHTESGDADDLAKSIAEFVGELMDKEV